jgi:hypothetical protein
MNPLFLISIVVLVGLIGIINILISMTKGAERDMLKKMYDAGDIDEKTYIKYSK